MTKSAPPLVTAEDVLGFPDQADVLIALERRYAELLDLEGRTRREREDVRAKASLLRGKLRPEQAVLYDLLRASGSR